MIVVWRVTQQCNLACPFCEWDRTQPGERLQIGTERVLRFGQVLADYQRHTGRRVLLSWLGGEPTLWPPLFDVAPKFKKLGIAQSTTTNGTTLGSAKIRQRILENFSELTVSVDGFADFHDRMRGWPGGWQHIRDAVMALRDSRADPAPLKLRANIVLMRDNIACLADLCDTLATWGFDEITFNALGGRDRPEFFPAHHLRPQDAQALAVLVPELRGRLASRGVRLCGGDRYVARIVASAQQERLAVNDCAPGEQFLFIDEFGRVAPCSFTVATHGLAIEDLRSVDDLLKLPAEYAMRRRLAPSAVCEDCPSTQVFTKFSV